jgi:hypothetical protein
MADPAFLRAVQKHNVQVANLLGDPPRMSPIREAREWRIPAIHTTRELADWLRLSVSDLDWFADLRSLEYKQNRGALSHYRYRRLTKRLGQVRLIEAPKPRLKKVQRQVHAEILMNIPPHEACHGFRLGRSVKTFAEPHTGKRVVLKIDLQDFFPSVAVARVKALFRTIGYPESVADVLAGLCSNATPLDVWDGEQDREDDRIRKARRLYANSHLPQGAPTSPQLANLIAYRLDCRLSALADSAAAIYTRYADDLAFSGGQDFARVVERFQHHACATVMEEGFKVHFRKTRIMRRGVRQRLAGVVVNEHLSLPRNDRDRLKATLTNCIRFGADSQNRSGQVDFRAHLNGRVSYVEMINPNQGARLRRLFDQIEW